MHPSRREIAYPSAKFIPEEWYFSQSSIIFFPTLMSWNSILRQKYLKDEKRRDSFVLKKKIPTLFVISMGHEIFC